MKKLIFVNIDFEIRQSIKLFNLFRIDYSPRINSLMKSKKVT